MSPSEEPDHTLILNKIKNFEQVATWIPGIKIIQSHSPFQNLYICEMGQLRYGISQSFFRHLPIQEYRNKIFDPTNVETCLIGKSQESGKQSADKEIYIRYPTLSNSEQAELIFVEPLYKDHLGVPLITLTQILPSTLMNWAMAKTMRIIDEMSFMELNKLKYRQLTKRSKEVLALMVKGLSAEEIGQQLYIGVNTVNTHKRRVKEILEIKSNYELLQYGMAFDLI
ncbi:helix-turn-helix transcriptional regulator [uncultured Algoriphagus sp.]|uniref:helix-turn-helix domain-containing protein n=1 Tax=uncultured Algoriphagus sp. TaxID=417365 RepID=UPI0030EF1ABE|tara:strand:+ start:6026 stop:6703 length:678 start_codon:yes stop_codon:yes gene_type:complete